MSAWPDLKKQIAVELESLNRLVDVHRELLVRCRTRPPDAIEISALSALLHSFYTGLENLFKRVALQFDEGLPRSEGWHMRLLDRMAEPGERRPAVISGALRERLHGYLAFRHAFGTPIPTNCAGPRWRPWRWMLKIRCERSKGRRSSSGLPWMRARQTNQPMLRARCHENSVLRRGDHGRSRIVAGAPTRDKERCDW